MNKKLIKTLLVTSMMLPAMAFAQNATTTATTTSATTTVSTTTQTSAICLKNTITARNSAIDSAREVYNLSVKQAQEARKNGMELASTTVAKKAVVTTYKEALKKAQLTRVEARKTSDAKFKADSLVCKNLKKAEDAKKEADKKAEKARKVAEKKKAEIKSLPEDKKEEIKSIRDEARKKVEDVRKGNKSDSD